MVGELATKARFGLFAPHGMNGAELVWAQEDAVPIAMQEKIGFLAILALLDLQPPFLRRWPELFDFLFFEYVDSFFFDGAVLITMAAGGAGSACPLGLTWYTNLVGVAHWATITHHKLVGFEKRPDKEAIMLAEHAMDRDETLELLRSQHVFPGLFLFRVVVVPEQTSTVVSAMVAAAGDGAQLDDISERPSRNNKYIALRVGMELEDAERVLDVYQVLQTLDGIMAVM